MSATAPSAAVTTVPVTWSELNLTGSLVYISPPVPGEVSYSLSIQKLNLLTGEIVPIFTTTGVDWIFYVSVSPDARQLVMSYISQSDASANRALYRIPLGGTAAPELLFSPPTPDDHYVHAEWSPDGKYVYYAHYNSNNRIPGRVDPVYDIFRMSFPVGQTEKIADNAFWPRISSDSTSLVHVSINPDSGKNELYVANADGSNARQIGLSGSLAPEIIDAPIFSPDGQFVIFSAPPPLQAYRPNWFETLLGIQVARANEIPSDWWSVPVTGGVPTRLTQLQTIRLFASLSPDKKHIASLSGEGIFVMDQEGSNLTQVLFAPGVLGTVSWIP
jgi:Tol biopolymer transport system component